MQRIVVNKQLILLLSVSMRHHNYTSTQLKVKKVVRETVNTNTDPFNTRTITSQWLHEFIRFFAKLKTGRVCWYVRDWTWRTVFSFFHAERKYCLISTPPLHQGSLVVCVCCGVCVCLSASRSQGKTLSWEVNYESNKHQRREACANSHAAGDDDISHWLRAVLKQYHISLRYDPTWAQC